MFLQQCKVLMIYGLNHLMSDCHIFLCPTRTTYILGRKCMKYVQNSITVGYQLAVKTVFSENGDYLV